MLIIQIHCLQINIIKLVKIELILLMNRQQKTLAKILDWNKQEQ